MKITKMYITLDAYAIYDDIKPFIIREIDILEQKQLVRTVEEYKHSL